MSNTIPPGEGGCQMRESAPGAWECLVHRGPEWEAARAMGAKRPCQIPLDHTAKIALARQNPIDAGTAALLLDDPVPAVRHGLAEHHGTLPASVLAAMMDHEDPVVRGHAAQRKDLPEPTAWRLARDVGPGVRSALALCAPFEAVLWHLSQDPDAQVRRYILSNPSMPKALLWALAEDPTPALRGMAAEHRNATADLLKKLARDPEPTVRTRVARSNNLPAATMRQLAGDPDVDVRAWVAEHEKAPQSVVARLAEDPAPEVRQAVAGRATGNIMELLSRDPDPDVRITLVESAPLTPELWRRLAADSDVAVRTAVARCDEAPRGIVEALTKDPDEEVRETARFHLRQSTAQR